MRRALVLDLDDLAGTVDCQISDTHAQPGGPTVVLIEQDLGRHGRRACWAPIPATGDDRAASTAVNSAIDQHLRPWRHADASPFALFELFPRAARARRAARRFRS